MPRPAKRVPRDDDEKTKKGLEELTVKRQKMRTNQENFLKGLKEKGTILNGLRKAGVKRWTYGDWMSNDPTFPERVLDARQEFAEALEEVIVGIVMDPDAVKKVPVLAITLLNANLPNKYRPQAIMQEETARDLLKEWRRAAQAPKEESKEELSRPVEKQIEGILSKKVENGEAQVH